MRPLQDNDVFHAIAHPVRRAMLSELRGGERRVTQLAEPFAMSFAAVSSHLRILEEAKLVSARRDGRYRIYELRPRPLGEVATFVDEFAAFFDERLDALGKHLDRKHGRR